MMGTEAFIGYATAIAVIVVGLLLLGAIIRFSIISGLRTKSAPMRLRNPNLSGVEQVCGFSLPSDLASFFEEMAFIERTEFELVDDSKTPPRVWPIGSFIPLTPRDVRESRKVSGVPGVPIAGDLDKGTYFVVETGAVRYRSPDMRPGEVTVASSIAELRRFKAREAPASDA
jgi:hypothetical protein